MRRLTLCSVTFSVIFAVCAAVAEAYLPSGGMVSFLAGGSSGVTQTPVDGSGHTAQFAQLNTEQGFACCASFVATAVDSNNNLYMADNSYVIRKVTPAGVVTTFAGSGSNARTDGTGTGASFSAIRGMTFNAVSGYLVVLDNTCNVIRNINVSTAVVTTVTLAIGAAGTPGNGGSCSLVSDGSGNLYLNANNGASGIYKYTYSAGSYVAPYALTATNNVVNSLAVDYSGNIFVTGSGTNQGKVFRGNAAIGATTWLTGNGGTSASIFGDPSTTPTTFMFPQAMVVGPITGNLYVSDQYGYTIFSVNAGTGYSTIVAGVPSSIGYYGNATYPSTKIGSACGLATDSKENIYIVDCTSFAVLVMAYNPALSSSPAIVPAALNLATSSTVATASSYYALDSCGVQSPSKALANSYLAANGMCQAAYDGCNFWSASESAAAGLAWFTVDLGAVYNIAMIQIWPRTDCCQDRLNNFSFFAGTNAPTASGTQLTTLYSANPLCYSWTSGMGPVIFGNFPCVATARYVTFQSTTGNATLGTQYVALCQLGVYAANTTTAPGIPEQPPSAMTGSTTTINGLAYAVAASSSYSGSTSAAQAFDKTATTYWNSNNCFNGPSYVSGCGGNTRVGEWLTVTFPYLVTLSYYTLQTCPASNAFQVPLTWVVQGSNDNATWVTLDTRSVSYAAVSPAGLVSSYIPIPAIATGYSYLSLMVTGLNTATYSACVAEWRIYGTSTTIPPPPPTLYPAPPSPPTQPYSEPRPFSCLCEQCTALASDHALHTAQSLRHARHGESYVLLILITPNLTSANRK